jgi:hypothetical protein
MLHFRKCNHIGNYSIIEIRISIVTRLAITGGWSVVKAQALSCRQVLNNLLVRAAKKELAPFSISCMKGIVSAIAMVLSSAYPYPVQLEYDPQPYKIMLCHLAAAQGRLHRGTERAMG